MRRDPCFSSITNTTGYVSQDSRCATRLITTNLFEEWASAEARHLASDRHFHSRRIQMIGQAYPECCDCQERASHPGWSSSRATFKRIAAGLCSPPCFSRLQGAGRSCDADQRHNGERTLNTRTSAVTVICTVNLHEVYEYCIAKSQHWVLVHTGEI